MSLRRDLSHTLAGLRRRPAMSLTIVLTLAVAIGANSLIFGLLDAVLLAPLPFEHSDRIVALWGRATRAGSLQVACRSAELHALARGHGADLRDDGAVRPRGRHRRCRRRAPPSSTGAA